MAWTPPKTDFDPGDILTADEMNAIGENLDELAPFFAAWTDYTPSIGNLTQGNGTLVAKELTIGDLVFFYVSFTFGSTSSMGGGALSVTLPTAAARIAAGTFWGEFVDAGSNNYPMMPSWSTTSAILPTAINTAGTYGSRAGVSTNVPFTWGNTDAFYLSGLYEAA